jgi:hypothetical protein
LRSLIIPPLGMSTGFSMFVMPAFRIPVTWGLGAFVLGALVFAHPLVSSPQLTVEDGLIMMRRSRWFLVVILALAAVRLGLTRVHQQSDFCSADCRTVLRARLRNDRAVAHDAAHGIPTADPTLAPTTHHEPRTHDHEPRTTNHEHEPPTTNHQPPPPTTTTHHEPPATNQASGVLQRFGRKYTCDPGNRSQSRARVVR